MHEEHRLTELDSGVRIVTEHMDSVRSVALGFWIGTGSVGRVDRARPACRTWSSTCSSAGTRPLRVAGDRPALRRRWAPSSTRARARRPRRSTPASSTSTCPRRFDVMADMVWRPRFAGDDLDNERQIVLEEIAMYEDDPQDKVFDVLGEAVFGDASAGPGDHRPHARSSAASRPPTLPAFHAARYVPGNVVIAAAGQRRPRRARRRSCTRADGRARRGRPRPASRARPRMPRAAHAVRRQAHRAVPRAPRRARASPATTTAASRCASSTTSSAARRPRGCSRRCARSAAWPTPSTPSSRSTPGPARSASTSARGPTTSRAAARGRRPPSSSACAPSRPPPRSCTAPRRTSRAAWSWRSSRPPRG